MEDMHKALSIVTDPELMNIIVIPQSIVLVNTSGVEPNITSNSHSSSESIGN